MIKVAINGYGRIGRVAHRVIIEKFSDQIELVGINGSRGTDIKGWMYLLKYDTAYGLLSGHEIGIVESSKVKVQSGEERDVLGSLVVDRKSIPFFSEKEPGNLPWRDLGVDVVLECTGNFTTKEKLVPHLAAGAKKVILSAPDKDGSIRTFVLGVNEDQYTSDQEIIDNASCTTNCIAPVAQIIASTFGVQKAMMTTIHAYTSDQRLQDGSHKDYRRARTAAENIVPTSTGATLAAAEVVPELTGLFTGLSIRVPVVVGSLSDFTFLLKRKTTVEEVNKVLADASHTERYRNILSVTDEPLVSSDIVGSSYSSIVDLSLTQVVDGDLIKVIAWYDNEWGYANRLVEEVLLVSANS
jgi:glyceraldehyde 3-phosphate dehydrogenase